MTDFTYHYDSPLGGITLTGDENALTGLGFDRRKNFAGTLVPAHAESSLPVFREAIRWLDIYFSGRNPGFTPPLNMRTSPFRKTVWEIMLTIPYGKTMTYGEIARIIARDRGLTRMAAQAVGGAVGHNAIALIIPCHRVVGTDGSLTGYGGGIDKKLKLLMLEHADMTGLHMPKERTAASFCKGISRYDMIRMEKNSGGHR